MSLKTKLQRMKSHLSLEHKQDHKVIIEKDQHETIPRLDEWMALNCKPYFFDEQHSFIREVTYPTNYKHGKHLFAKLQEIISTWKEKNLDHPLSTANVAIEDLMFFDTETTGLSCGAGNYIFLIGYATVRDDEVVVKQHLLPNPSAEVAMYSAFLNDFHEDTRLISFNGKSFDWPQVKTRHVFVRDKVPALPKFAHFDLLHASRRLWKRILPSCKLSVIEKEILQFERKEDIPGYLAPMLYFDYLQENDPTLLESVLAHNEWDVLSLISLYIEISSKLLDLDMKTNDVQEYEEIGYWFESLGQLHIAIIFYERAIKQTNRSDVYLKLAKCYKKLGQYDKSKEILEEAFKQFSYFSLEGMIELAKLYEHQYKDVEKALFYAERAYLNWKERQRVTHRDEQLKEEITNRIERLKRKISQHND